MSIEVMTRIWKVAPYGGGTLLVLLALADYADDYGICWPAQPDVAAKARLTDRQLRSVLRQLETAGDLLVHAGKGRGNRTIYCVLAGLSFTERDEKRKKFPEIISGINFRVSPEKRKLAAQKAEVSDRKKRKFTAHASADLPQPDAPSQDPIRHVIRHEDPPPPQSAIDETMPIGGGGGEKSKEKPTETEALLLDEGFSDSAAHEFCDLDYAACRRDIKQAKAAGQQNGGIIRRWRRKPPTPPPANGRPAYAPAARSADDAAPIAALAALLPEGRRR